MRVALLQMDLAWEDVLENHRRAARLLEQAAAGGARLALLPEMFSTGFSMDSRRIAQPPGGPSQSFLREQAAACWSGVAVAKVMNWCAARTAADSSRGAAAQPIFQPVSEKVFPKLEIVIVRSRISGSVAIGTWRPS